MSRGRVGTRSGIERGAEAVSAVLLLAAMPMLGYKLRLGWVVGGIGGTIRIVLMARVRHWWYVALDCLFLVVDVFFFGRWSGWW